MTAVAVVPCFDTEVRWNCVLMCWVAVVGSSKPGRAGDFRYCDDIKCNSAGRQPHHTTPSCCRVGFSAIARAHHSSCVPTNLGVATTKPARPSQSISVRFLWAIECIFTRGFRHVCEWFEPTNLVCCLPDMFHLPRNSRAFLFFLGQRQSMVR